MAELCITIWLQADVWQPLRCWRTAGLDKGLVGESTSRRQGLRFERGRRAGTGVGHGGNHSIQEQPKTGASLGLNKIHRPASGRKPFPAHEDFPPRRNKVRKARQALHDFFSHSRNHEMDSLNPFTTAPSIYCFSVVQRQTTPLTHARRARCKP